MKRFIIIFILISTTYKCISIDIKVRVFTANKIEATYISPHKGNYKLICDGKKIAIIKTGQYIKCTNINGRIIVNQKSKKLGSFKLVQFTALDSTSDFLISPRIPLRLADRIYDDNVTITTNEKNLQIINEVDLEKYVAGVVESESGKNQKLEFYKVQAIISRTYALSNFKKRLQLGYNLNDLVADQVYLGKARFNIDIITAVTETIDLVLVDENINLITTAFHSNSGGYTVESSDVWGKSLSYTAAKLDTFSLKGSKAFWSKTIAKKDWLSYLERKFAFNTKNAENIKLATNYKQAQRQTYFLNPNLIIPTKEIRYDWELNSTFFDIEDKNDSLLFTGKGFGHGIGLSQQGAMRMVELEFDYKEILQFYYNGVHLINLKKIDFFK
jgi:stage II sporulation protein D